MFKWLKPKMPFVSRRKYDLLRAELVDEVQNHYKTRKQRDEFLRLRDEAEINTEKLKKECERLRGERSIAIRCLGRVRAAIDDL